MTTSLAGLSSPAGLGWVLGYPIRDLEELSRQAGRYYRPFDRWEPRRKKRRHIDNPSPKLKKVQRRILDRVIDRFEVPDTFFGAVRGRSNLDHIEHHVGQPIVVTLDLRDCFARTSADAVFQSLCQLGCSRAVASLLTRLTTFQGRVPQGSPSSPALVNLTLRGLHAAIQEVAQAFDLRASIYVDDIALSGNRALEAIEPVARAIMAAGHSAPRRKIHRFPSGVRQVITGHTVNRVPSFGRTEIRRIRGDVHALGSSVTPTGAQLRSIRGRISHVSYVNPAQGIVLERLADRWLPASGPEGERVRSYQNLRCNHRRRHRWRP